MNKLNINRNLFLTAYKKMEEKYKTIIIKGIIGEKDYDLTIGENKTINDLRKAIEDLCKISYKGDLKLKRKTRRGIIILADGSKTIKEYRIKNEDMIVIDLFC